MKFGAPKHTVVFDKQKAMRISYNTLQRHLITHLLIKKNCFSKIADIRYRVFDNDKSQAYAKFDIVLLYSIEIREVVWSLIS